LQKVELIRDLPNLKVASGNLGANLLAGKTSAASNTRGFCTIVWWLAVIDSKFRAKEIRAATHFQSNKNANRKCFGAGKSVFFSTDPSIKNAESITRHQNFSPKTAKSKDAEWILDITTLHQTKEKEIEREVNM
jgi:hypothetical protein